MSDWLWIVIAVVAVLVIAALCVAVAQRMRRRHHTRQLQTRFGSEYDRAVSRLGRNQGERALEDRIREHDERALRDVSADERDRAVASWNAVQMSFVDTPATAVRDADHLVFEVLRVRGYPVDTVDDRADAISVERPELATRYRDAHRVLAAGDEAGGGDVKRLRDAFLSYRELLSELVGAPELQGRLTSASSERS